SPTFICSPFCVFCLDSIECQYLCGSKEICGGFCIRIVFSAEMSWSSSKTQQKK
ncbi:unnamed protein product, partial [Linum tenue]